MTENLLKVTFDKVIQTRGYTAIVLKCDKTKFAIFTEASTGHFLQMYLGNEPRQRPLSQDLLSMICYSFDITVRQVIITDVQENIFYTKLFLETTQNGTRHIAEIDSRPSDSLLLAFLQKAPVFCLPKVLSQIIPYVE